MRELLGRLSAVDVAAESAVRVIAFFDALVQGHAGLDALLRGAAALARAPVGLSSPERHVHLRVGPDGHRLPDSSGRPGDGWPVVEVHDRQSVVWIEREGGDLETDPMILERLAAAVQPVLERTRGRLPSDLPELVEVVLDAEADAGTRHFAARRLGLPETSPVRVVACLAAHDPAAPALAGVEPVARDRAPAGRQDRWRVQLGSVTASVVLEPHPPQGDAGPGGRARRCGIGPPAVVSELPRSWRGAVLALRLTADDSEDNPGPRQLRFDDLGSLVLLAELISPDQALIPDVQRLVAVREQWVWGLRTLVSLSRCASLRQAAVELTIHHSTLQERIAPLESMLGYDLASADGRHRLYLALNLYRLHSSGRLP